MMKLIQLEIGRFGALALGICGLVLAFLISASLVNSAGFCLPQFKKLSSADLRLFGIQAHLEEKTGAPVQRVDAINFADAHLGCCSGSNTIAVTQIDAIWEFIQPTFVVNINIYSDEIQQKRRILILDNCGAVLEHYGD